MMERQLQDWQHQYLLIPMEYPISDNNRPATYDQFMSLRDTLVFSDKYYAHNSWRSLIIGTKLNWDPTGTIEVREPNIARQSFEPWWWVNGQTLWKYVSVWGHVADNVLSCEINKKWRYALEHKEQFNNISSSITRIHSYIVQHHGNEIIERAVFDWERSTPWEIKRVTSYGYIECDLDVWDWLELKVVDQNWRSIISAMANNSNWRTVEYIDLAYNI